MKRKLFSLLVLLMTAVTGAWADATIAKLWVGNSEEVKSEGTITGTGATEGTASVAIENGSMVLTLNDFKFNGCGHNDSGIYYQSDANGNTPLIIKIEGDNEITLPGAEKSLYGFYLYGGNGDHVFTITGSGSLTVTVGDGNLSNGIFVQQADLVLAGGTVTANAGSAGAEFKSLGVSVPQGTLTIDGGTLKASGSTTSASRGINVNNNVTIKSGELEAYGYSKGIKNSGGDALVFAEGVTPTLFKAGDNETSATDVSKYEGQKYLHVVCTGGDEPAAPTGDGVNYALSVGTNEHGTVKFFVNETEVNTAAEGQTVTVEITPATGYAVDEATGKWYAAVANSRRIPAGGSPEIDLLSDITLTAGDVDETTGAATYTFTMERANAELSVTYKHRHIWDYSVEGDTLIATCQNLSGDCDVVITKTGIALPEEVIYGNNNEAAIDLTTFNEKLAGEGVAELVSISYKGTLLNGGATYGPTATVPTLPGDYTVTITVKAGDNNYVVSNDFTLEQKAMVGEMIVPIDNCVYNGQFQEPTVVVKDGDKVLTIGTDYLLGFDDNVNAGLGIVMVHGVGNYKGTTYATFNILDKELTADMIEAIADQSYTGQAIEPAVVVKDGETVLEEGRDYSVTYENNVEVGTATVIVTAWTSGNYRGEVKATFNIVGTTGISAANSQQPTANRYYDLGGRKAKATSKGVVIVDGKKVVIK